MPALPLVLAVFCMLHLLAAVGSSLAASTPPRDAPDGEVVIDWRTNPLDDPALARIRAEHLPEYFAATVSELFHLPRNLTLRIGPCGAGLPEPAADGRTMYLCTESVDLFARQAVRVSGYGDTASELLLDATLAALFQELGRTLPGIYGLGASAKNPETERRLGLWCLMQSLGTPDERGLASALNAADFFANAVAPEDLTPAERPFWQPYALTPEENADILCLAFGFDAAQTEDILGAGPDEVVPDGRASGCEAEYDRLDAMALSLLGANFIPEPDTAAAAGGKAQAGAAARK